MRFRLNSLFTLFVYGLGSIIDCNTTSIFRPSQLSLTPDPPIPGQNAKLTLVFYNTGDEIKSGIASTVVFLNGVLVSSTDDPLCESTTCPITPGSNDRSTESIFPSISGLIKSTINWINSDGDSLLCIDMKLKIY
jgi:hypothetical protein